MDLNIESTVSNRLRLMIEKFLHNKSLMERLTSTCNSALVKINQKERYIESLASRPISCAVQEIEDDAAEVNEERTKACQIVERLCCSELALPQLSRPGVYMIGIAVEHNNQKPDRKQIQEKHQSLSSENHESRHQFAAFGGYGGHVGNDDQNSFMGATATPMPSLLQRITLYLILAVSSAVLSLLPWVFGGKIPKLFLLCPWLFYGFDFALMLAAAASLVSLDAMSNKSRFNRSFADLAVLSILAAASFLLFSVILWAI